MFVWRSHQAYADAVKLVAAGVYESNPQLLTPLLSCVIEHGKRSVVLDKDDTTLEIMVIEGEAAGCRGIVPSISPDVKPPGAGLVWDH